MNGRQQAAVEHLKLVGRDVHRYASYALEYGLTSDQIKEAIADGVNAAAREEEAHANQIHEAGVLAVRTDRESQLGRTTGAEGPRVVRR